MAATDFKAMSLAFRVYSGKDTLENLPAELKRNRAQRAFILCGRTVSRRTDLIARMRRILGDACAGVFDEIEKDSTLPSVLAGAAAARAANADLLIGVGGGSVTQATRVVAILLAEPGAPHDLITQYPDNAPAISPKLLAPKLPILNVLTVPTSAQNRGGSALRDDTLDHRMEFFDPKTRPKAIFWDADALLTAPSSLIRTAGCSVYWRSVMNLGWTDVNPLLEGVRLHAHRLAARALPKIMDATDAAPRIELCAAAFLLNRDADEGGNAAARHWVVRATYAFATSLFISFPQIGQGEANTALTGTVMRRLGSRDPRAMANLAQGLGVWNETMPLADAPLLAADYLDKFFTGLGMPTRLRDLDFPREGLAQVLENSLKNFNADPKREFVRERDLLHDVLQAAW
ncbi:MAG: iron-containing alcohol dehydrogenase family protein [Betaproteobacteria bacterium]